MAEPVDPFTRAYNAVWDALEAWGGFTKYVRLGNRLDFANRPTVKQAILPADCPEVSLVPAAFVMKPFGVNSKSSDVSQSFQLVTVTDKLLVIPLNRVKYHTFVALLKAGPDLGLANLCRGWNVTDGLDGSGGIQVAGTDATRGLRGFASLLTITLDMYFPRADLLALTPPT